MTHFESNTHDRFREFYLSGDVPWDHADPPPEVIQLASALTPGRALDLGCGYGRAAVHLARHGWTVDAIDLVAEAIEEARRRAAAAGVADRIRFIVGDVTDLSAFVGPYDLAIDVGCGHRLPHDGLRRLRDGLARLLAPGGRYLLFAKLHAEEDALPDEPRWLDEKALLDLFDEGFCLERSEHGLTERVDAPPMSSAWYWFRRVGDHSPDGRIQR